MKNTKYAILITIFMVMRKYKSFWCYASQMHMLELLEKYHKIVISRRQLNYHLHDLRAQGFIKTWKRHKRDEFGRIHLVSSASCISLKGCYYLVRKGVSLAIFHMKQLRKRFGLAPIKFTGKSEPEYSYPPGQNGYTNGSEKITFKEFLTDPVPA